MNFRQLLVDQLPFRIQLQSDMITRFFEKYRIPARIYSGDTVDDYTRFLVQGQLHRNLNKVEDSLRQLLKLSVYIEAHMGNYLIWIYEPLRFTHNAVNIICNFPAQNNPGTLALGLVPEGLRPLLVRMDSVTTSNILLLSPKGTGKQDLMTAMITAACITHEEKYGQVALLGNWEEMPGVYTSDVSSLLKLARKRAGREYPYIFAFVHPGFRKDKHLWELLTVGPSRGIFTIMAANKPSELPPVVMHNGFGVRIVGRVATEQDSDSYTGIHYLGAEELYGGEFLALMTGSVYRFWAMVMDPYDKLFLWQHLT